MTNEGDYKQLFEITSLKHFVRLQQKIENKKKTTTIFSIFDCCYFACIKTNFAFALNLTREICYTIEQQIKSKRVKIKKKNNRMDDQQTKYRIVK